jgi:hypothetical protein
MKSRKTQPFGYARCGSNSVPAGPDGLIFRLRLAALPRKFHAPREMPTFWSAGLQPALRSRSRGKPIENRRSCA